MNVKRFTARTSRDALVLVRQVLGEDAVVLSTKPSVDGVEVLAMAPEGMQQIERMAATVPETVAPAAPIASPRHAGRIEPVLASDPVDDDVKRLSMSTLSFQDYVRERMLRRRQAALAPQARTEVVAPQLRNEAGHLQTRHELGAPQSRGDGGSIDLGRHEPLAAPMPGERGSGLEQRMSDRAPVA